MVRKMARVMPVVASIVFCLFLFSRPAHAGRLEKAVDLVADAAVSVDYFANDSKYRPLWNQIKKAEAVIIIPRSTRAGFVFGGSGGNGAMISRQSSGDGVGWSEPAFLRISSFSFGLQAGGEVSEIILLVMTKAGVDSLLSTSVKLGADLTIAAGPVGGGAKAQTTDILAYQRSRGLYGSISIEGGVLKINRKWNAAYYGQEVSPEEILYRQSVSNPQSSLLKSAINRLLAK